MNQNNFNLQNNLSSTINSYIQFFVQNKKNLIKWFIIIVSIFLFYLIFTKKEYTSYSKIKILNQEETSASILEDFIDISNKNTESINKIDNEIEILKSKNLLERLITKLKLNHNWYSKGIIFNKKLSFNENPLVLNINNNSNRNFTIKVSKKENVIINNSTKNKKIFSFNKYFVLGNDSIQILKNPNFNEELTDLKLELSITDYYEKFISLKKSLKFNKSTDEIILIYIEGINPIQNENILKNLLKIYNQDRIHDKQIIGSLSASFLADRIETIRSEILVIENSLSEIKRGDKIYNIEAINSIFSNQKLFSEELTFQIETQELLAKSFLKKITNHNHNDLLPLPIEIGIKNMEISNFTNKFNNLIIEKNNLLKGRTIENPEIKILNNQMDDLLKNLNISINNYLNNLTLKKEQATKYDRQLENDFFDLNNTELTIVKLTRELDVKESILFHLLEKKEENNLKLSIINPIFKYLDFPYTNFTEPKPNNLITLFIGLILAVLIPFSLMYLKKIIDNKIITKNDLNELFNSNTSFLGEIPLFNNKNIETKNIISEVFNLIRTNISFLKKNKIKKANIFLVTSSSQSEGKTFTAVNLVKSIANINHKVLLLGLDLRRPTLLNELNISDKIEFGVSSYLTAKTNNLEEIIYKNNNINFDIIFSGPLPPNPNILLSSQKFTKFIDEISNMYNYIIIDSAPCIPVSDTLNIIKHSDITIYLTKSNTTSKKAIKFIAELSKSKIKDQLALILNGISKEKGSLYNYGYGYGYNKKDQESS